MCYVCEGMHVWYHKYYKCASFNEHDSAYTQGVCVHMCYIYIYIYIHLYIYIYVYIYIYNGVPRLCQLYLPSPRLCQLYLPSLPLRP